MPKTVSIQEAVIYDCCNKNCLKFYNIDGSLDYGKTSKLIMSSRESIATFTDNNDTNAKWEACNWWMSKLDSSMVKNGGECNRSTFQYSVGKKGTELYKSTVCRNAFCAAYGISDNQLAYRQDLYKKYVLGEGTGQANVDLAGKKPNEINRSGRVVAPGSHPFEVASAAFSRAGFPEANDDLVCHIS